MTLSNALHLDKCVHKGPSVIDHRTLARSKGLSRDFLRGCGLPDYVIEDALEPERKIDRYWSCFISYSSHDQEFVDRLYAELQEKGVRCWFAPKDMPIGAKIRDKIDEAIRWNEKVLLVLSERSVRSDWVEKETETAFEEEGRRKEIVLFPIRLDGTAMSHDRGWIADIRRTRNIGDFSRWKEAEPYRRRSPACCVIFSARIGSDAERWRPRRLSWRRPAPPPGWAGGRLKGTRSAIETTPRRFEGTRGPIETTPRRLKGTRSAIETTPRRLKGTRESHRNDAASLERDTGVPSKRRRVV